MKKTFYIINLIFISTSLAFAELSPDYMYNQINNSNIKTPAKVTSIKTLQSKKGYKIQLVKFKGLYENENKTFEAKCHNFDTEPPISSNEPRKYHPQKGDKVYVTIDKNGGEVTSMVSMDEKFEKKLQNIPKSLKFDCNGAYFEE